MGRPLAAAVGLPALAATGCWAVNVMDGADARWAVAAWLLLVPVALADAVRGPRAPGLAVAGLGATTALVAAWLGDRAGVTAWWLAAAAAWWAALALRDRTDLPGLAVLDGLLAAAGGVAAAMVAAGIAEPALSAAGLWTALLVPWAGWRGVSWLSRRAVEG